MNDWIACFENDEAPTLREEGPCRFPHDHLLEDNADYAVAFDGLLLNLNELCQQHQADSLLSLLLTLRQADPKTYFKDFRGPFTGLFYDKHTRQAEVFTNQTGDSAVFHYAGNHGHVFSSNYTLLLDFLKKEGLEVHFDEKAAHWMLTFGFLIDEATYVQEIKQLNAGKALYLEDGCWNERRYHRFSMEPMQLTEDEALEKMDALFRQAVRRCFDKDLEYGYREHLVDMSAGMDSRMVNWVAKAMGYTNITNISYSQTGSEEERLSKKAADYLGNTMVFEALDGHEFVYDIDALVDGNFGTYEYTGITGGARLLSKLDFSRFGAEQTGQLGDAVVGGSLMKGRDPETMRLSHRLPLRYDPNPEAMQSQDLYGLYTRGFKGAMSSWFIRKQYTFALSPFIDVDLMRFCYSLPPEMRRDHHLYWRWVERYYPEALRLPTSRKRKPVTVAQRCLDLTGRATRKGLKLGRKVLFKVGLAPSRVRSDSSMNPYDYWYDTDPKMRQFIDDYYHDHIELLNEKPQLLQEAKTLFEEGNTLEKLMCLTVLCCKLKTL